MTIHDCIHLMFPEYLPNRLALTYARASLWAAARVSNRILTVSETSKRDILRFFDVAAGEDQRHLQRHRRAVPRAAARRRDVAGGAALSADRRLRAVRRQRQAAQEPRAADRRVPPAAAGRPGPPEADRHRRRDLEVRRAAARGAPLQPAQVRAVSRLHAGRDAGRALPAGGRVRVPVALRRLRPAAARSHGERRAGRHLERVVAAGGGGRRGRAGRSARPARHRRRHPAGADRARARGRRCAPGASRGPPSSRGSARSERIRQIYGEVAAEP